MISPVPDRPPLVKTSWLINSSPTGSLFNTRRRGVRRNPYLLTRPYVARRPIKTNVQAFRRLMGQMRPVVWLWCTSHLKPARSRCLNHLTRSAERVRLWVSSASGLACS